MIFFQRGGGGLPPHKITNPRFITCLWTSLEHQRAFNQRKIHQTCLFLLIFFDKDFRFLVSARLFYFTSSDVRTVYKRGLKTESSNNTKKLTRYEPRRHYLDTFRAFNNDPIGIFAARQILKSSTIIYRKICCFVLNSKVEVYFSSSHIQLARKYHDLHPWSYHVTYKEKQIRTGSKLKELI